MAVSLVESSGTDFSSVISSIGSFDSLSALLSTIIVLDILIVVWLGGHLYLAVAFFVSKYRSNEMKTIEPQRVDRSAKVSKYVKSILPELSYKGLMKETFEEIPVTSVWQSKMEFGERWLVIFRTLTTLTFGMFMLAFLYDIQFPTDDGSCSPLSTQSERGRKRPS